MAIPEYFDTLKRFGLGELKWGDLQVKDGDIAVTPDGDFQFRDPRINTLFRLVERWRLNKPMLDALCASMLHTSQRLPEMRKVRAEDFGASLARNPAEFHEESASIGDYKNLSSDALINDRAGEAMDNCHVVNPMARTHAIRLPRGVKILTAVI